MGWLTRHYKEVLFSKEYARDQIGAGAWAAGSAVITKDKNLLLVSVLKGSVVFMADLMRAITIPCSIDFMAVSSYGAGVKTSGVVRIIKDLGYSPGRLGPLVGGGYSRQRHDPELHT